MCKRLNKTRAIALVLGSLAVPAFAQTTIDTTAAVSNVALGVTAIGAIGVVMLGFTVLKRVWRKVGG